jgi:hypothetical protein
MKKRSSKPPVLSNASFVQQQLAVTNAAFSKFAVFIS